MTRQNLHRLTTALRKAAAAAETLNCGCLSHHGTMAEPREVAQLLVEALDEVDLIRQALVPPPTAVVVAPVLTTGGTHA
jgi:hypothetical protein